MCLTQKPILLLCFQLKGVSKPCFLYRLAKVIGSVELGWWNAQILGFHRFLYKIERGHRANHWRTIGEAWAKHGRSMGRYAIFGDRDN